MKRTLIIWGIIITSGLVVLTGCGASKGFVQDEINKSETKTSVQINEVREEIKPVKESYNVIFQTLLTSFRAEKKILTDRIDALDKAIRELEKVTLGAGEHRSDRDSEPPKPTEKQPPKK